MADEYRYVMLKDQMKRLELPLLAMAAWAFGLGVVGLLPGGSYWIVGLLLGVAIGAYAAFGRSWLALVLRVPAIVLAAGMSVIGGGR